MKEVFFCILFSLPALVFSEYFRVCYVTNWAQYRKGTAQYIIKDHYVSGLCTHLLFAFAKIEEDADGNYVLTNFEPNDFTVGYPQTQKWKEVDPKLKTMLSVGGYSFGSKIFSQMVKTEERRKFFIEQSVKYLKKWGFDGLDIDWEFPAKREGSSPEDKPNLTKLCKEIKSEYKKHGLIVSAAVIAETHGLEKSYDVAGLFEHLDFVNLMSYDLHGPWESTANHHTDTNPDLPDIAQSMDNTIDTYIRLGAVPEKIVLGLASYGKVFQLEDQCSWKLHSPTAGKDGTPGEFTGEAGLLSYYEICSMKMDGRVCTKESKAFAPYASKGSDFINYDDEQSIALKVNRLVKRKGKTHLKGIMIWALDFDDFNNVCKTGKYPLWQAAIDALEGKDKTYSTCENKEKSCVPTTKTTTTFNGGKYDTGKYIRACYITNWAQYRSDEGKFDLSKHYEHGMCSHLFYAFAKITEKDGVYSVGPHEWNDLSSGYPKTAALKVIDPKLKTILSLGGRHKMELISGMLRTHVNRNSFIQNTIKYLQTYKFDGIEFHYVWKWPNTEDGGTSDDKQNFMTLIKEMKTAFSSHNLLIAVTVIVPDFYYLSELSNIVDMINIRAFESLRMPTSSTTSHPTDMDLASRNSIYKVANDMIEAGVSADKLVLGLSTTAQSSELSDSCEWNLASSTTSKGGKEGKFTKTSGILAYYEVCSLNWKNHVCTGVSPVSAPYGSTQTDFVAYDDEASISIKMKKVVMELSLKGVSFWALDFDDFAGSWCRNGKYPLVKAAIQSLRSEKVQQAQCRNKYSCGDAPTGVKPSIDPSRYYRICYFTNWAQYRTDEAKFDITKNYEIGLCTHMIYAFAKIGEKADGSYTIQPYEWNDLSKDGYEKVVNLKTVDHNLKVLLSIGGTNHKSAGFTDMVKTKESREKFIQEAWKFLTLHKFDGLDIAWEFPGRRGGNAADKVNFAIFLEEAKKYFSILKLMLTVTVDGKIQEMDTSYDVFKISSAVSFINVLTYNYVEPDAAVNGHHLDSTGVKGIVKNKPIDTINAWIQRGADPKKLVLGISAYARTQKLEDKCQFNLGDATKEEGGRPGYFTKSSGMLAYYETCRSIWNSRTCSSESEVRVPYGSTSIDFISYDDEESISLRLKEVMIGKQLLGFSFWAMDLDDFWNSCKSGTYPLLKAAKDVSLGLQTPSTCKTVESSSCGVTKAPVTTVGGGAGGGGNKDTTKATTTTTTTTTERSTTPEFKEPAIVPKKTTTSAPRPTTTRERRTFPSTTTTTGVPTTLKPIKTVPTLPPLPDVDNTYARVCFFTDTARERPGAGAFDILKRYETDLCTHLVYTDGKIIQLGFGNIIEIRVAGFKDILYKLKQQDRGLRVLLGVGKDQLTDESLRMLMNKPDVRKQFIEHAALFLVEYGFDGLDITWNPPRNIPVEMKYRFTSFCSELKGHFRLRNLLISATISGEITKIDHSYEVDKLSRSLDMINILTFSYYNNLNTYAAHHTDARFSSNKHDRSIDNTLSHLINRGAIPRKLVLGLSMFAQTYDLKKPERYWELGSSVFVGGGQRGKLTDTRGMLAYYEVCKTKFVNHVCTSRSQVKAPYGCDGETFIGYDDPNSIQYKIEKFMLGYRMRGFMINDLAYDDFNKECGHDYYPLVKAARDAARSVEGKVYNCTNVRTTLPPPTEKVTEPAATSRPTADVGAGKSSANQLNIHMMAHFVVVLFAIIKVLLC